MVNALWLGSAATPSSRELMGAGPPELVDWLRTGRLTLVDENRRTVSEEDWSSLPGDVRSRALADFHRVVRSNAKAAVIFLR